MKKILRRVFAASCTLALCLTFAGAVSVEQAVELLEENYVGTLPAAAYEAKTLDELFGIVGDPYSYYMDAEAYERFNAGVEGESSVTGIGVSVRFTEEGILILNVLTGGGAKEAGLRSGDLIIAVDGESCVPGGDQYISKISGEAGTSVDITVRRADGTERTFTIVRRLIELHNTTVSLEDGVGYIECESFGSHTASYFRDGLETYADNARAWIVDLRGNGGGYASAAVYTAGVFGGPGVKLYFVDRSKESSPNSYWGEDMTDSPAIVLVNAGTASASEIFAGDIRAEDAGIVVGSRTYGKGLAQLVFDSGSNPNLFSNDAIKISVYRFYCSDGNTTDKIGVLPTLYVSDQYASAVAALLTAKKPATGEYLTLTLNGSEFTLDPAAAKAIGYDGALTELLSALPPDVSVKRTANGSTETLTSVEALARYGDASAQRGFSDVSGSPYATEINTLGTYGILLGQGSGRFAPERMLTRAELCAMLSQALNIASYSDSIYSDVDYGSWYCRSINAVTILGLMNGVDGGRFAPDTPLTQEQFITVMGRLVRFLNFRADNYANALPERMLSTEELSPFASWARTSAQILTSYDGNMLYTELGSIDPAARVTREQAAATLCNVLKGLDILSY